MCGTQTMMSIQDRFRLINKVRDIYLKHCRNRWSSSLSKSHTNFRKGSETKSNSKSKIRKVATNYEKPQNQLYVRTSLTHSSSSSNIEHKAKFPSRKNVQKRSSLIVEDTIKTNSSISKLDINASASKWKFDSTLADRVNPKSLASSSTSQYKINKNLEVYKNQMYRYNQLKTMGVTKFNRHKKLVKSASNFVGLKRVSQSPEESENNVRVYEVIQFSK